MLEQILLSTLLTWYYYYAQIGVCLRTRGNIVGIVYIIHYNCILVYDHCMLNLQLALYGWLGHDCFCTRSLSTLVQFMILLINSIVITRHCYTIGFLLILCKQSDYQPPHTCVFEWRCLTVRFVRNYHIIAFVFTMSIYMCTCSQYIICLHTFFFIMVTCSTYINIISSYYHYLLNEFAILSGMLQTQYTHYYTYDGHRSVSLQLRALYIYQYYVNI